MQTRWPSNPHCCHLTKSWHASEAESWQWWLYCTTLHNTPPHIGTHTCLTHTLIVFTPYTYPEGAFHTAHSYNKPFMLSPLRSPLGTMPATHISTHTHKYTCVNPALCLQGLSWGPAVTTWEWGPADRECVREQPAVKAHSNTCIQRHVYKRQQRCCSGPAGATCRESRKWEPWMYEALGVGCHVSSQVLSLGKCLKKQDAVSSLLTLKSSRWKILPSCSSDSNLANQD